MACGQLQEIQIRNIANIPLDRNLDQSYATINALLREQKSNVEFLTPRKDRVKDNKLVVEWTNNCGNTLNDDCDTSCDITPKLLDLDDNCVVYDYSCKSATVSVNEKTNRTIKRNWQDDLVSGVTKAKRDLANWYNREALIFLYTNAQLGYNAKRNATGITSIPDADYNLKLMSQLLIDAEYNGMQESFLIDFGRLYPNVLDANFDKGTCCGAGDASRVSALPMVRDIRGLATAGISQNELTNLVVDPYSYITDTMVKTEATTAPDDSRIVDGQLYKWNEPLGFVFQMNEQTNTAQLVPVRVDVFYKRTCDDRHNYSHTMEMELNYLFKMNPYSCPTAGGAPNGLLGYKAV